MKTKNNSKLFLSVGLLFYGIGIGLLGGSYNHIESEIIALFSIGLGSFFISDEYFQNKLK